MGQLEARCFAQGSDNALYALAYGYDLSVTTGDSAVAALLKSNVSPSNPSALTWQVVSTTSKGDLFSFLDGMTVNCLVDPNGAFLAWSYSTYRPGLGPTAQSRPGGFRYDPSLTTSSATTKGKGGWVNVETPLSYSWNSATSGSDLFYVKDGTGKYNVYHAFSGGAVINFGSLNTAVTPNMMENSATKWSVGSTITGYIEGVKATATKFFVWGVAGGSGSLFSVGDLPQTGSLPTTASSLQLVNYTTPIGCSYPAALGDKVYRYCPVRQLHGDEYKLFSLDGLKVLDPIGMSQLPVESMYKDTATGIFGDSSSTYMLIQSGRLQEKYGATGFGDYALKALALTGAAAGSVLSVPNNITVPDNIAFYANTSSGGSSNGTLNTIIGISTTIVVVCCGLTCARKRRRRQIVATPVPAPASSVVAVHTTVVLPHN